MEYCTQQIYTVVMILFVIVIAVGLIVGIKTKELFWVIMWQAITMGFSLGLLIAFLSLAKGVC